MRITNRRKKRKSVLQTDEETLIMLTAIEITENAIPNKKWFAKKSEPSAVADG